MRGHLLLLCMALSCSSLSLLDSLHLYSGLDNPSSAITYGNYTYFGTYTSPATIVKIDNRNFTIVDTLTLNTREDKVKAAVVYENYGYFGTQSSFCFVIKVDLDTFTRVDSLKLTGTGPEFNFTSAFVYGNYGYFSTWTAPAYIAEIDLTNLTRIARAKLPTGEDYISTSALVGDTGYFALVSTQLYIVQYNMSTFSRIGSFQYPGSSLYGSSAVSGNDIFFFGQDSLGSAVRVRTDPSLSFTSKNLTQSITTTLLYNNYALLTTTSGLLLQVNINNNFAIVNSINLTYPIAAAVLVGDKAYYGTATTPGIILRVDLSNNCLNAPGGPLNNTQMRLVYGADKFCGNCADISAQIICLSGKLTGFLAYEYAECQSFSACPCPDYKLFDGDNKTVYLNSSYCTCSDVKGYLACNNGTVSGNTDYTYAKCNDTCSCSNGLNNGESKQVYQYSCGTCVGATQYCNKGVLEGENWLFDNCTEQCSAVDSTSKSSSNLTVIIVVVIVVGVVIVIVGIVAIICRKRKYRKSSENVELAVLPTVSEVTVHEKLGDGNFGEVYRGTWKGTKVALKKLRISDDEFVKESYMLSKLSHPNIVQFLGIYENESGEKYIVTEYMEKGDLLSLIRKEKMSETSLVEIAGEAASGMVYLEDKNIVHRDLALRNFLVGMKGQKYVIKISDFGLSRVVDAQVSFYQNESSQLPVKWSAPESLKYGKFSSKSDVWSFGVCLWELFSKGETPYFTMSNQETMEKVANGYRLPMPEGCPHEAYQLMLQCWNENAEERPSFLQVMQKIQSWMKEEEQTAMTTVVVDRTIYN